jgi:hypothetical protein
MICRFCGMETNGPIGHQTQAACIHALEAEVLSLKRVLTHTGRIVGQVPEDREEIGRRREAG